MSLPHMGDPQVQDVALLSAALDSVMTPAQVPRSIIFASEDFGLHHLRFDKEAGAYTDQTGRVVAQWESKWDRPELWLLDFHQDRKSTRLNSSHKCAYRMQSSA